MVFNLKGAKMESLIKKVLFYGIAIMLAGCVPSLHRLYVDDNDVVFDEKLLGNFHSEDPDWKWSFERYSKDSQNYKMTVVDDDKKMGQFNVHLVKIDDMRFLDVYPEEPPDWSVSDYYKFHLIGAHTFIKANPNEPNVVFTLMGGENFNKFLEKKPNVIKHERIDSDMIVLTALPEELQGFLRKYANDPNVFADPFELVRISDPNSKEEKPQ